MMKRTLIMLAACGVFAAAAHAKANFGGDWKLNTASSDFGQFPAPSSMTQKNTQDEASLKVAVKMATDNGDFDWESSYKLDGGESVNQFGPGEMRSKCSWEGDTLVINTKGQFGDSEVTMVDKWQLSADGKTLTIARKWSSSRGEIEQKIVLEKQ